MNISRPTRCLFSGSPIQILRPRRIKCRDFHSAPTLYERHRPKHKSIKASAMGLTQNPKPSEIWKNYTAEEKKKLQKIYTPGQMAAIEAGEQAIKPEDLGRTTYRTDIYSLDYFDDLSVTRPILDRRQQYEGPVDPNPRIMNMQEAIAEVQRVTEIVRRDHIEPELPEEAEGDEMDPAYITEQFPNRAEAKRIFDESSFLMGSDGKAIPHYKNHSLFAPRLPKQFLDETVGQNLRDETPEQAAKRRENQHAQAKEKKKEIDEEDVEADPRDPDGTYNALIKQSGMTLDDIMDLRIKILVKHRVVNQTRLGKIASQYALAIAGDGKGRLGYGEAKGQEVEDTYANARITAIRAMQPIPRYESRTIYGDVEGKMSAVEVKLMARPPGFGLRCQHLIFEMARAAGIQDLAAKVPRSRNKMNTVKATYSALMKQRIPDEVARARGKKLVDVRKVYYGGKTTVEAPVNAV